MPTLPGLTGSKAPSCLRERVVDANAEAGAESAIVRACGGFGFRVQVVRFRCRWGHSIEFQRGCDEALTLDERHALGHDRLFAADGVDAFAGLGFHADAVGRRFAAFRRSVLAIASLYGDSLGRWAKTMQSRLTIW